jgi:hypothetical protein
MRSGERHVLRHEVPWSSRSNLVVLRLFQSQAAISASCALASFNNSSQCTLVRAAGAETTYSTSIPFVLQGVRDLPTFQNLKRNESCTCRAEYAELARP